MNQREMEERARQEIIKQAVAAIHSAVKDSANGFSETKNLISKVTIAILETAINPLQPQEDNSPAVMQALRAGRKIIKAGIKDEDDCLPLEQYLWMEIGREFTGKMVTFYTATLLRHDRKHQ